MFISYPAVVIRYVGKIGILQHIPHKEYLVRIVETIKSYFGTLLTAEEGKTTIADLDSSPFFIIHNGPIELPRKI